MSIRNHISKLHPDEAVVLRVQGPKEDGENVARHVVYLPEIVAEETVYTEYRIGTVDMVGRLQTVAVRIRQMTKEEMAKKAASNDAVISAPVHFLEEHWLKAIASARRRHAAKSLLWIFLLPLIAVLIYTSATTSATGRITLTSAEMAVALVAAGVYALLAGYIFRYAQGHGVVWTQKR